VLGKQLEQKISSASKPTASLQRQSSSEDVRYDTRRLLLSTDYYDLSATMRDALVVDDRQRTTHTRTEITPSAGAAWVAGTRDHTHAHCTIAGVTDRPTVRDRDSAPATELRWKSIK